jgi:hypothetical protein
MQERKLKVSFLTYCNPYIELQPIPKHALISFNDNDTLDDLAKKIIDNYKLYFGKCYGFYNKKNFATSEERYELFVDIDIEPSDEEAQSVRNTLVKDVFLFDRKIYFLYSYQDELIFSIDTNIRPFK